MDIRGFEGRLTVGSYEAVPNEPYTALLAVDRQAVIDFFDKCKALQDERGLTQDSVIWIHMPCGYYLDITTHDDIPTEDLLCPCGDEGRYVIRYGKE